MWASADRMVSMGPPPKWVAPVATFLLGLTCGICLCIFTGGV